MTDEYIYNALSIVKTAITYWNAKKSGSCTFKYVDGHGCLKGNESADLFDNYGNAIIDCSTFVGLVMRGIGYLDSPYFKSKKTFYNPKDISIINNNSYNEPDFDLQQHRYTKNILFPTFHYKTYNGHYRILTASDMAKYYEESGTIWLDSDNKKTQFGDLCFFCKTNKDGGLKYPNRFRGISHVGIMLDREYYLNVTDYEASGNLIRTSVKSRKPDMYARPKYERTIDSFSENIANKQDLLPDVWADIPQGRSVFDGRCLFLEAKTLTITTIGTQSSSLCAYLVHPSCPITLPAGTYRLTGVTNNTSENMSTNHKSFGIKILDSQKNPISGYTTTANGIHTRLRNPVWDIGGGAEFTLKKETRVIFELYLSANKNFEKLIISPKLHKIH